MTVADVLRTPRDGAFALAIVVVAALLPLLPPFTGLYPLDIDVLHGLRARFAPITSDPADAPVAVIAIDEVTHASAPFQGLPKVMWTPQIARIQDAVLAGGARVFGWDVILPTSASAYVADRRFDRPLLRSLAAQRQSGRVVLGGARIGRQAIAPHRAFAIAAGGAGNVRLLNVAVGDDGVVREVPLMFPTVDGNGNRTLIPSMALELAVRALETRPAVDDRGRIVLADHAVRGVRDNRIAVNFAGGIAAIPTYSFADLHRCAQGGNEDYFKRQFADKVVLFGLVLDIEDRKVSANRFAGIQNGLGNVPACQGGQVIPAAEPRTTTPGVYLHAAAVANLIQGNALDRLDTLPRILAGAPLLLLSAILFFAFGPLRAAAGLLTALVAWTVLAVVLFLQATVLPLLGPVAGAVMVAIATVAFRFLVADKEKRFLARAFSTYVSPNLVAEIVKRPDRLALGGERRECTFLFTDLADYTALVEKSDPARLLPVLNDYMDGMISIAFQHGGTVDKIIGDALVVMFAAPVYQDDHADRAVACARDLLVFADAFAERQRLLGFAFGRTRIGVNTGPAMVGNFGGKTLFDYTAQGDTVNVAARLESVNKALGTGICVSGATARKCVEFRGRPVGELILKGKESGTEAYEPLTAAQMNGVQYQAYMGAYEAMKGNNPTAAGWFAELAQKYPDDPLIAFHHARLSRGETGMVVHLSEK